MTLLAAKFYFFFQAEDGIRDSSVTGVQTCGSSDLWLTAREFLDALALGQLTPGPILMVAAFVGYKLAGIAGALAAAVAIFLPSFLLMLVLLPWFARIKQWQWMRAALKGVVPAVIGVRVVALGGVVPRG